MSEADIKCFFWSVANNDAAGFGMTSSLRRLRACVIVEGEIRRLWLNPRVVIRLDWATKRGRKKRS